MAYLTSTTRCVMVAGFLLAGCGGGSEGETCGDSARWSSEVVQTSNEPSATLPTLAFADDGTLHAFYGTYYFDEDFATEYGGVNWLRRSGVSWDDELVEGIDQRVDATSFELAGDRMHFAWMFAGDLFYRERAGDAWTGPASELTASEPEAVRTSAMALGPEGELAVVYGVESRVRLAWIEDGGIAGEPVTLLEEGLGCNVWHAGFDARGALHVGASCWTDEETSTLQWITVAPGGSAATEALWSTSIDQAHLERRALISPNGDAHLLWVRSSEEGLLHARRVGGTWTEPVVVAPPGGSAKYAIVAADDDEVIVAYQVEGDEPALQVKFLSSREGQPLAPDCERLPDLALPIEGWWPALAFDAGTGTLVTLYNTEQTSWPDGEFAMASLPLSQR